MRVTQHSARIKSAARHNDRDFDTTKASHIDSTRTGRNEYYNCYEGMTFKQGERQFYNDNFGAMINDINERAQKAYHPERMTNADKLLASKKTMPEEVIFQIGNKDSKSLVDSEKLMDVFDDFNAWHQDKFGDHIKVLNAALHVDEETPHIHVRRVWTYQHENGYQAIGQHKALKQMGYELPNPDAPRGKNNNLKQVYTAECREKWLDLCEVHGLKVEREPENRAPNEQNLQKNEFIIMQQQQQLRELELEKRDLKERFNYLKESCDAIDEELLVKEQELLASTKEVRAMREELTELRNLKAEEELLQKRVNVLESKKRILEAAEVAELPESVKTSVFHKDEVLIPRNQLEALLRTAEAFKEASRQANESAKEKQYRNKLRADAQTEARNIIANAQNEARSFSHLTKVASLECELDKYKNLEQHFPREFEAMEQALASTRRNRQISHGDRTL